ncbi:MAG: hypothetical protein ACFFC3_03750 [Candidatus Odinarchaeota archaeon]
MNQYKISKKLNIRILFLIFSLAFAISILNIKSKISFTSICNNNFKKENPNIAYSTWGWVNLTNSMINETRYYHNEIVTIEGHLFHLSGINWSGKSVSLKVDGVNLSQYTDLTDQYGKFKFDYLIPNSSNIYTDHKFEAVVNDPDGAVVYLNHFIINFISHSTFTNVIHNTSLPLLIGEELSISGDLKLLNGSNIPSAIINYSWSDGTDILFEGSFNSNASGSFGDINIVVPNTNSNLLALKLNFSGNNYIDYTETYISNITLFSNITWNLNIDDTVTEGEQFTIIGTLFSSTDPSLRISNREIEILLNGIRANTTETASDGSFSATFQIPEGNGTASIQAQLTNGLDIRTPPEYILIEARPIPPISGPSGGLPPLALFSLIFFPILAAIGAALGVYGFFYYRKREKESRVVNIPLESRIENLKILKDSGRLEESISYLYNAIYMDLINAKYNRKRNVNETIRDFAIISVKELKLTPSSIYPFIQKVEEIIYAKPFKILDQDFYNTCELFSPIYFQLTGYNFVLNF